MLLVSASPYLFAVLVTLACGTAAILGGSAGRWTALLYIAANAATWLVSASNWDWSNPNVPIFWVDATLLVGLYVIALRSRRYWPLWMAGLHLLTVTSHLSAMIAPGFFYRVYFLLEVGWSLPKMAVLLIGPLADWRRGRDREFRRGFGHGHGAEPASNRGDRCDRGQASRLP